MGNISNLLLTKMKKKKKKSEILVQWARVEPNYEFEYLTLSLVYTYIKEQGLLNLKGDFFGHSSIFFMIYLIKL